MQNFTDSLLSWFENRQELYPWRGETDPYRIWLSEVMLQQTQTQTVIPYYRRWLDRFPTIKDVAEADEQEVLKMWEGLGYYSRARNFHRACQQLLNQHEGRVPAAVDKFRKLPGVGPYIAAAVSSIAFHQPSVAIDGNVRRVVSRLESNDDPAVKMNNIIDIYLKKHLPDSNPGDFNQALMDLGRSVCTARAPQCTICPVQLWCRSYVDNVVDKYPPKKERRPKPHYNIAVGVIWKCAQILVARRPSQGLLGGLWEFPGGKVLAGETERDAVRREVEEELGILVEVGDRITAIKHVYTHFSITMAAYHCQYRSGEPQALGCSDWRWIHPNQIGELPFPGANHKLFPHIPNINPLDPCAC